MANEEDGQDEVVLLRRFREGDDEAFRTLLERHGQALSGRIRRNLPPHVARRVAVSDVLQESCLVAYRRRESLEDRGTNAFRNWLLGIVDNKVREAVRRHERVAGRSAKREVTRAERIDTALFAGTSPTPSQHAVGRETAALTREAMARLSEDYQEILRLTRIERLTLREAAERMGRSREATKKLYGRALCRLKTTFDEMRSDSHG